VALGLAPAAAGAAHHREPGPVGRFLARRVGRGPVGGGSTGSARSTGAGGRDLRGDGLMVGLGDGLSATSAPADPAAPDDSADPTAAVAGAWAATARARPSAAAAIRLMRTASVDRQMPRIRRTHIGYEGLRSRAAIMTQMTPSTFRS